MLVYVFKIYLVHYQSKHKKQNEQAFVSHKKQKYNTFSN